MTDAWSDFPAVADDGGKWADFPEASTAADVAKSAGIGLAKGAIAAAGTGGDLRELIAAGAGKVAGFLGGDPEMATRAVQAAGKAVPGVMALPTSQEVRGNVESVTGPLYEPQTTAGKYAQTAAEFIPAAVAGPGSVGRNLLRFGIAPGLASEAAGQYTQGTDAEPYARAGAAIAGGVGGALLMRPGNVNAAVRSQLPDFVTDAHVADAERLIRDAGARGVTLTWPEALSQVTGRPVLTDTQRILESTARTRPTMQGVLGDRPQQVEGAARQEFDNIAPQIGNPSSVGPAASEAAGDAVNSVRQRINQASEPFYQAAAGVTLTPQEMAQVRTIPGYAEAARAVRGDPQLNRHVANLPENSVGFLNEVKKYLDQAAENAGSPVQQGRSVQRQAGLTSDAGAVRQAALDASQRAGSIDYATALGTQQFGRERYLEPLLNGPLGRIADKPDTRNAINALFPPNPLANSEGEISHAVGAIAQRNPWAATQLVRAHAEMTFNEAAQDLQSGANSFGGAKFASRIAGNSQQRANLQAAVEALPNGQARWQGFQRFLDIMEATGTRQPIGSKTAFNAQELAGMKAGGPVSEATKLGLSPGKWLSLVYDKWGAWQQGRNLDGLAKILTDPNSGDAFRRILQMPPGSREATALAARIIVQSDMAANDGRRRGSTNAP